MEVSELRKEIIERINEIEDEQQLLRIEVMIENLLASTSKIDFWDELPDEVKKSIEAGLKDADEGRTTPHEQVMKEMRKKFNIPQ
jgi:predicted transcriptional regulator